MTDEATSGALTGGMRRVLWAAGSLMVVGIVVVVWLLIAPNASEPGAAAPDSSTSAQPGASGAAPGPAATQGPVPGATPTTGSEVQSPDSGSEQQDPNRLPPIPPAAPLITRPLPASATASGSLVKDFPASVAGPMDASDVVESSIATEDAVMQVALVARTDSSRSDIIAHYTAVWQGLGLAAASTADGLTATGPYASLSLAISSSGTGTVYSIFGVLRAE